MGRGSLLLLAAVACAAVPAAPAPVAASVLVRADDLAGLAAAHGLAVVRPVGRSGWGVLSGPPGRVASLRADPSHPEVAPLGATKGAIDLLGIELLEVPSVGELPDRWFVDALGLPPGLADNALRVAILDSGVAHVDLLHPLRAIPAPLRTVTFEDGRDLVDGDGYAGDEHQHGSHVASTIAGRLSGWNGVARGATVVPIRVLDEDNQGDEWALVEGLHLAVDADVDVINLSLSFGDAYRPSRALLEAIQRAHEAGIVLVAASGNEAASRVAWPAASPHVIAVGASTPDGAGGLRRASYTSTGLALDVVAPGGELAVDRDGDGFADAIAAHTIDHQDPYDTGVWFAAGTSQAAGLASAAILRLLQGGVPAGDVRAALQAGAVGTAWAPIPGVAAGSVGHLHVGRSRAAWQAGARGRELHAALLPYLEASPARDRVRPAALVAVIDGTGAPVTDVVALIEQEGSHRALLACRPTGIDAACVARSPTVVAAGTAHGWSLTLHGLLDLRTGLVHRATPFLGATEGWTLLVEAMADAGALEDSGLAIHWTADTDPRLGRIAPGYTLLNAGSLVALAPTAVVTTPEGFEPYTNAEPLALDTDGTGFATSETGVVAAERRTTTRSSGGYDGGTQYTGGREATYTTVEGSSYGSEPVGWRATDLVVPRDDRALTDALDVPPTRVVLEDVAVHGADLEGTALLDHLLAGGFVLEGGREGALDWLVSELGELLGL